MKKRRNQNLQKSLQQQRKLFKQVTSILFQFYYTTMMHLSASINMQNFKEAESITRRGGPISNIIPKKTDALLDATEAVLKKNLDSRNNLDQNTLTRFIVTSEVLSTISNVTSIEMVRTLLKHAHIHDIPKHRILYKQGSQIDRVIILLRGKFTLVQPDQEVNKFENMSQSDKYQSILERAPIILKDMRRKKWFNLFQIKELNSFKTTTGNIYEMQFNNQVENEAIFDLDSLVEGKKYKKTVVSRTSSKILSISAKLFIETFNSFLKKMKAEKISTFRNFQCFNLIEDEKLLKLVEQLQIKKKKKGEIIYQEGDEFNSFYLLFSGSIKVTKNINLFTQDPNNLYIDRQSFSVQLLPFANLSSVYNYKPRNKTVELGIVSDFAIFGEEQMFSKGQREVSVQVNSPEVTYYELNPKDLQNLVPQKRNFLEDFKNIIWNNRCMKKILYRQECLSQIIDLENKNNMDYFYIDEKGFQSVNPTKFQITRMNRIISPERKKIRQKKIQHSPAINIFNFTKMHRSSNITHIPILNQEETKITQLAHTVGLERKERRRGNSQSSFTIDIYNPLFELDYFKKNRKEVLRIEKESRMRTFHITHQRKSKGSRTLRPKSNYSHRIDQYF